MKTALLDMGLGDLLELRERLSEALVRRFERSLAIAFTDVVGSTEYFAAFGDEAGRGLLQRHLDLLGQALARHGGRIVDTAGDGAFTCFATVDACAAALFDLEQAIVAQNAARSAEHHLRVRAGVHFGPVLTDGVVVTGDAVNLCARVTASAGVGEIRLTRPAVQQLAPWLRGRCHALPPAVLKGIPRPVEMALLPWREESRVPTAVRVEETGVLYRLPDKPTITVGRLREHDSRPANDVVLGLPDRNQLMKISRWHLELRRQGDTLYLHPVSDQTTEVDGTPVPKGQSVRVVPGSVARLSQCLTMTFLDEVAEAAEEARRARPTGTIVVGSQGHAD